MEGALLEYENSQVCTHVQQSTKIKGAFNAGRDGMVLVADNAIFSPTIGNKREVKFNGEFDKIYSHL